MPSKKRNEARIKKHEQEKINKSEKGNVKSIATALLLAIQDNYITYRQFKEVQSIIDEKFDKPSWVPKKKLTTDEETE